MKKLIFALTFLATLFIAMPAFAYTVQEGDTMMKIARKHHTTLKELTNANPQVKNPNLIIVGQVINTKVNDSPANKRDDVSPATVESNSKVSLSKGEIDLLARIVRAEAEVEPFNGKVAVAAVILNRVENKQFPNTIKEVIYQSGQFQPVRNGQINKPADKESIKAVHAALSDMRNIVKDSLFFYNPAIATNRWLDSKKTTYVIGQHVFKK